MSELNTKISIKWKPTHFLAVIAVCFSANSAFAENTNPPVYVLGFLDMNGTSDEKDFLRYWSKIHPLVERHGGQSEMPIATLGELENPGSVTIDPVDLRFDYMTVIRFTDRENAENYIADKDVIKAQEKFAYHADGVVRMIAAAGPGPAFSSDDLYEAPGFLLLNPMTMESDPEKRSKLPAYSNVALPMVQGRGVNFFAPFFPIKVVQGETNMGLIYITNWPSVEVFNEVHNSVEWLEVMPARNEALAFLSDIQGNILHYHK